MFNFLRRSKVVRKSTEDLDTTKTKWTRGKKVTVKRGVSRGTSHYKRNTRKNQKWFKNETIKTSQLISNYHQLFNGQIKWLNT